jgi:hypothetical protein
MVTATLAGHSFPFSGPWTSYQCFSFAFPSIFVFMLMPNSRERVSKEVHYGIAKGLRMHACIAA